MRAAAKMVVNIRKTFSIYQVLSFNTTPKDSIQVHFKSCVLSCSAVHFASNVLYRRREGDGFIL